MYLNISFIIIGYIGTSFLFTGLRKFEKFIFFLYKNIAINLFEQFLYV